MSIADNIAQVRGTIAAACQRAERDVTDVMLIAVSKTQPAQAVLDAMAADLQHFGENRVEEAEDKIPQVRAANSNPTWHMVGHLQSRKAKDALKCFDVVHSVESLKLAEKLARGAAEKGMTVDMLLEINVSGEQSKYGLLASGWQTDTTVRQVLFDTMRQIALLPNLRVRGLMTMAPIVEQMEAARPVFAELARLRDAAQEALGIALPDLSMGMTDDYPIAIEEGATMVRIGRAIFGQRL
jgi:PLP dependent protein